MSYTLSGCVTTKFVTAPINPELTKHEPDPPLEGDTWGAAVEQSIKRAETNRRWNCKGYALRKEPLPEECK